MSRFKLNILAGAVIAGLAGMIGMPGCTINKSSPPPAVQAELPPAPATNLVLQPGPNDPQIAYVTGRLLEEFHYSQQLLDKKVSARFFNTYVDELDPRHENFLQGDLAEFAFYRTNLDTYTIRADRTANLAPAYAVYARYLQRIRQHADYVNELLREDKFKFTADEHILLDRRHAPYPKNLDEARQLWLERLRYEYLQEKLSPEIPLTNSGVILPEMKSAPDEIAAKLMRHYRWNLRMVTNWDSTDVLQAYLNALAHAYDPHSDYFNTEHAQDFSISMSLSLFGIGAQLSEDDGYCTISSLVHGGPAEKGKQIHEKDRIIAVAQGNQPFVDVVDMELNRVVQLIRGSKGSQVRLMISPAEDRAARRMVTLVRDEIKLEDQEAKAQLIESPDGHGGTNRIGIIDLPSFYATIDLPGNANHSAGKYTTVDVARLINKLKSEKVSGIILDLRNNPGGSLEEAVKFTGLFIQTGPVVLARSPEGQVTVDSDTDSAVLYDGPLVVLVNRASASASEIVAAALQDYERAIIVGDISTFGKGTVQNLNPLRPFVWPANASATNDPGTAKITIRKFYRVSGASTQFKGVMSDIVLPDILNYMVQFGESSLDNPLPWDTIKPVNYSRLDLVQPVFGQPAPAFTPRLATNQEFIYIRQDIDEFQKRQADKTASLNEHERVEERQEADAARSAGSERAARKAPNVKIYEISRGKCRRPGPAAAAGGNQQFKYGVKPSAGRHRHHPRGTTPPPPLKCQLPKGSSVDAMLDETELILEDYISLVSTNQVLVAK